MIDRELDPLPWEADISTDSLLESYALTYLAKYNTEAPSSRTIDSFQRAYAMDSIQVIPRVNGGKPAYSIARWTRGPLKRMTIAIEGTSSLGQLWSRLTGNAAVVPDVGASFVMGFFDAYATTIFTELAANSGFMSLWSDPATNITFAGYSLGGAVAEILALKFYNAFSGRQYHLCKFGSPRVGDTRWQSFVQLLSSRVNYYCGNDRIDLIPFTTLSSNGSLSGVWQTQVVNYCRNRPEFRRGLSGLDWGEATGDSFYQSNLAIAWSLQNLTADNPWIWHDVDRYRYSLTSLAFDLPEIRRARFAYLEFNDDNMWGQNFPTSANNPAACKVLAGSPPTDVVVDFDRPYETHLAAAVAAPVPAQPLVIQGLEAAVAPVQRPRGGWIPRRTRDLRSGTP